MFVEEGFRIRFANGEIIDFYADTTAQKEEWMSVLSETVGKDLGGSKAWTNMVLDKERREKARNAAPQPAQTRVPVENPPSAQQPERPQTSHGLQSKSVPSSPVKSRTRTQSDAPLHSPAPVKGHSRTRSDAPSMPSSPAKGHSRTQSDAPPPIEKDQRHKAVMMPRKREVGQTGRRDQVRSMVF
jgi:hypothetical protein